MPAGECDRKVVERETGDELEDKGPALATRSATTG